VALQSLSVARGKGTAAVRQDTECPRASPRFEGVPRWQPMSIAIDVFIRFKGSKKALLKVLEDDFLILLDRKQYWFLNYIELGLRQRSEDREYFVGHQFRPYDFVLGSTTYAWSSTRGTVRDAHSAVMDVLAQSLAFRLRTRTMVYSADLGTQRRYRYVRAMKRNKGCVLLNEKTGKPPKGFF
jgi:hypothetical protein